MKPTFDIQLTLGVEFRHRRFLKSFRVGKAHGEPRNLAEDEPEVFPYLGDERLDPSIAETSTPGPRVPGQWEPITTELHPDAEPTEFDRYEFSVTEA